MTIIHGFHPRLTHLNQKNKETIERIIFIVNVGICSVVNYIFQGSGYERKIKRINFSFRRHREYQVVYIPLNSLWFDLHHVPKAVSLCL